MAIGLLHILLPQNRHHVALDRVAANLELQNEMEISLPHLRFAQSRHQVALDRFAANLALDSELYLDWCDTPPLTAEFSSS